MKTIKQPIQIATIGAIMNTVVMNVYLDHIDLEDSRGPIVWYKEPKGRKVKGQLLDDKLIVLPGWDNFEKYVIKSQHDSGFAVTEDHWDGNLNLATTVANTPTQLWEMIYKINGNPNFTRWDLLKINDKVLYTLKETLEDETKTQVLKNIFNTLEDSNNINEDELPFEDRTCITMVGKSGATWYLTEWNPAEHYFFGYASLFHDHNDELGTISESELVEMNAVVVPHSQGLVKDQKYYKKLN